MLIKALVWIFIAILAAGLLGDTAHAQIARDAHREVEAELDANRLGVAHRGAHTPCDAGAHSTAQYLVDEAFGASTGRDVQLVIVIDLRIGFRVIRGPGLLPESERWARNTAR